MAQERGSQIKFTSLNLAWLSSANVQVTSTEYHVIKTVARRIVSNLRSDMILSSWLGASLEDASTQAGGVNTVGFQNFNLRIFNSRVSNPNNLIVDVF